MSFQDHSMPPPQHIPPQLDSRHLQPDVEPVRARAGAGAQQDGYLSDSSRYSKARKPINEAVNSAFSTTQAKTGSMPPEILEHLTAQITANVLQQLKSTNLAPNAAGVSSHPPTEAASSGAGSPPIDRAKVYTPPSPFHADDPSQPQKSPGRQSMSSHHTYGSSPKADGRPMSPLSQDSRAEESDAREDRPSRPQGPRRVSTNGDMTVVERAWGKLFNEQGDALPRLGQFLRGLAIHMIEDFEPKHSLVVTPVKMQQYYEKTKLAADIYPWNIVFDDRTSSISRMLRELEVEHHLVQQELNERPDTPGLTPQGFATWMTILLKAHPGQEYERLAKTALDMPIDNPDDRKERFPKEVSRRLFPTNEDKTAISKLQKAMATHCNVNVAPKEKASTDGDGKLNGDTTAQLPPSMFSSHQSIDSRGPPITPITSKEAMPNVAPAASREQASMASQLDPRNHSVSSTASGSAVVSDDDAPTPQPIERERKPYTAQPGQGKHYETADQTPLTEIKPGGPESKLRRSASTRESHRPSEYLKARPAPIHIHQDPSAPIDIPDSRHSRANSTQYRDAPGTNAPRRRSPSAGKDVFHQHFDGLSNEPSSFDRYAPFGDSSRDNARRYREYESQRERYPGDRYDAARMAAYDPRERERENRPRGQSAVGFEPIRSAHSTEDEYYRNSAGYPPTQQPRASEAYVSSYTNMPNSAHYPPSAYRETR